MRFNQKLKGQAVNGLIKETAALSIGNEADALLSRSVSILKKVERQVGLTDGEEINALVADITGTSFNPKAYYHNREPEGQD